ncbi:hypothetical protein WG66_016627 [Moniliophthora roreri]|nr:hypothetical protein WG66_016627 [Moniliophthora roreri]
MESRCMAVPPFPWTPEETPRYCHGHGWSCNKLMSLAIYAERFTTLGYGCLVFDYRRWGDSDGIPRNIINVKEPLEDYRTVIE